MQHITKADWVVPWLGGGALFWGAIYFIAGVALGWLIVKRIAKERTSIQCLRISAVAQAIAIPFEFYILPLVAYLAFSVTFDMWTMAAVVMMIGVPIEFLVMRFLFKIRLELKDFIWLLLWSAGSLVIGVGIYLLLCMGSLVVDKLPCFH